MYQAEYSSAVSIYYAVQFYQMVGRFEPNTSEYQLFMNEYQMYSAQHEQQLARGE